MNLQCESFQVLLQRLSNETEIQEHINDKFSRRFFVTAELSIQNQCQIVNGKWLKRIIVKSGSKIERIFYESDKVIWKILYKPIESVNIDFKIE